MAFTGEQYNSKYIVYNEQKGFRTYDNQNYFNNEDHTQIRKLYVDPNTKQTMGVSYHDDGYYKICIFERRDLCLEPSEVLYEGYGVAFDALKTLPNSDKMSFKNGRYYYLLDTNADTTIKLDIENGHNLDWVSDQVAIYTKVDFTQIFNSEIRSYNIETGEDLLLFEKAYGSSLSSNKQFLAYGRSDSPSEISILNLETKEANQVTTYDSTLSNHKKYEGADRWTPDDDYVTIYGYREPGVMHSVDFEVVNTHDDLYDLSIFKPSSDGKHLLYQSSLHPDIEMFEVESNSKKVVYKNYDATTISWVDS